MSKKYRIEVDADSMIGQWIEYGEVDRIDKLIRELSGVVDNAVEVLDDAQSPSEIGDEVKAVPPPITLQLYPIELGGYAIRTEIIRVAHPGDWYMCEDGRTIEAIVPTDKPVRIMRKVTITATIVE
mgnify:CR=1 FL=1